jgi:hypothetical protein
MKDGVMKDERWRIVGGDRLRRSSDRSSFISHASSCAKCRFNFRTTWESPMTPSNWEPDMSDDQIETPRVAIHPFRCLSEASHLVADRYLLFVGLSAVAFLLGVLTPMGILMGSMMCGLSLCYFRKLRQEEASFDVLFKGFDYFIESLIASLIIIAVTLVFFIPFYVAFFVSFFSIGLFRGPGFGNPPPAGGGPEMLALFGMMAVFYLVVVVVMLLVSTLTAFVYPLIVDRELKAIPALKLSLKAVMTNFWGMLGLTLLNSIIVGLAYLCCLLPTFLVLPITFGANIIAYRRVFPDSPNSPAAG